MTVHKHKTQYGEAIKIRFNDEQEYNDFIFYGEAAAEKNKNDHLKKVIEVIKAKYAETEYNGQKQYTSILFVSQFVDVINALHNFIMEGK